jgi:hypothetical protein
LKIARYACKIVLSISSFDESPDVYDGLSSIEKGLGTSRKAYRIGKFLKNVSALTKQNPYRLVPSVSSSVIEVCANVGEGLYYFVDQFQFLVKVGVLSKEHGRQLTKISACAELLGYFANTVLNILRLHNLLEREIALISELQRRKRKCEAKGEDFNALDDTNKALLVEISQLRKRRIFRTLCLVQDAADSLLAVYDLKEACGGRVPSTKQHAGIITTKTMLAAAGLLSGCIGAYKRWPK